MRKMIMGFCALAICVCLGCASDGKKSSWEEAKKDLRGDNMKMRGDFGELPTMDKSMPSLSK